jgi:hypothetical protein
VPNRRDLVAGLRLWLVKPHAVGFAQRFLLTYLIANAVYCAFWIAVIRPTTQVAYAEMGWYQIVAPAASVFLWYSYLEHSKIGRLLKITGKITGRFIIELGLEPTTLRLTVAAKLISADCCGCLWSAPNPMFVRVPWPLRVLSMYTDCCPESPVVSPVSNCPNHLACPRQLVVRDADLTGAVTYFGTLSYRQNRNLIFIAFGDPNNLGVALVVPIGNHAWAVTFSEHCERHILDSNRRVAFQRRQSAQPLSKVRVTASPPRSV